MVPDNLKCVLLGDDDVGKSSIVYRCLFDEFDPEYVPTSKQEFTVNRLVTNNHTGEVHAVAFHICDTGGLPILDRLRPLCYGDADVLIICFSVMMPSSYKNVLTRWMPEIKRHTARKNVSLILVGTQIDLRSNFKILLKLSEEGLAPISECKGLKLAEKIGATCYIECSAVTRHNVEYLFDTSLLWSLRRYDRNAPPPPPLPTPGSLMPSISFRPKMKSPILKQGSSLRTKSGKIPLLTSSQTAVAGVTNGGVKSVPKAMKKSTTRVRKVSKLKTLLLLSCFA